MGRGPPPLRRRSVPPRQPTTEREAPREAPTDSPGHGSRRRLVRSACDVHELLRDHLGRPREPPSLPPPGPRQQQHRKAPEVVWHPPRDAAPRHATQHRACKVAAARFVRPTPKHWATRVERLHCVASCADEGGSARTLVSDGTRTNYACTQKKQQSSKPNMARGWPMYSVTPEHLLDEGSFVRAPPLEVTGKNELIALRQRRARMHLYTRSGPSHVERCGAGARARVRKLRPRLPINMRLGLRHDRYWRRVLAHIILKCLPRARRPTLLLAGSGGGADTARAVSRHQAPAPGAPNNCPGPSMLFEHSRLPCPRASRAAGGVR